MTQVFALLLCATLAFAQQEQTAPQASSFSQQELDQMLAPVALYPDSLLSQILMASTYPLEVVEAARWARDNPGLAGAQATAAADQQRWDPSVKSLVAFPQVLSMMDQKLSWTERLGDAFLANQAQVMDTVQSLRRKAYDTGNLRSSDQALVEQQGTGIAVESPNPEVVYVPYYDPMVVYGPWWWPGYTPVYWDPWPGYYARPGFGAGFAWGVGITVGAGFFFGAFDWGHRHLNVVNMNNNYYHARNINQAGNAHGWEHDAGHRRGVPYRDSGLREQYGRGSASSAGRQDFRGHQGPLPPGTGFGSRPGTRLPQDGIPPRGNQPAGGANERNATERGAQGRNYAPPPIRPNAEQPPHAFEHIERGSAVRNDSARGQQSVHSFTPPAGGARPPGNTGGQRPPANTGRPQPRR